MAELTWIVSKILDCNGKPCDWVIVSPTGGTGSATPTITINEGVGPNDCEEAYVYISASTKEEQIIPITRCVPECSCKAMGYNAKKITTAATAGETIQIATYNDDDNVCVGKASVEVDGIVLTSYNMGGGVITATVSPYDGTEDGRTGWFKLYYDGIICSEGKVIQGKGQDSCDSDACPDPTVLTPITFPTEGGTQPFALPSFSDCLDVNYSVSSSWVSVDLKNNTISAERNTSVANERTATVTFIFTNSYTYEECPRNVTLKVTQAHDLRDCDCNDLVFESIDPEPEDCKIDITVSQTSRLPADIDGRAVRIGTFYTDCNNADPNFICLEEPGQGEDFASFSVSDGVLFAQTIHRNASTSGKSSRYVAEINGTRSDEFWVRQSGQPR